MKIKIKVKPRSKESKVVEADDFLKVFVKSPPEGGKANEEVIELISKYFGVKKSSIRIVSGFKSREKIVEIED